MNAHVNAMKSPNAVFHTKSLDEDTFESAKMLTPPVQLFDACPTCDGAAAVILTSCKDTAKRTGTGLVVRVAGSGAASDILPVAERPHPLHLHAVAKSTEQALGEAGLTHEDVDIFELHDACVGFVYFRYHVQACL